MEHLLLLAIGLPLALLARPRPDWSGEHAADFCAALLLIVYGGMWAVSSIWQHTESLLLLEALSWYAALPLLVLVSLARCAQPLFQLPAWDRVVWGRILLALCVVFELTRRNGNLEVIPLITLAIGTLAAIGAWLNQRNGLTTLAIIVWGTAVGYVASIRPEVSAWLPLLLLPVLVDRLAQRQQSSANP